MEGPLGKVATGERVSLSPDPPNAHRRFGSYFHTLFLFSGDEYAPH